MTSCGETPLCHVIMASSESEADFDRQRSNHSDNTLGMFDDDSKAEKELEDDVFPYRFEPCISDEGKDSKGDPADIERLQNVEWYCTLLFTSQTHIHRTKVHISGVKKL